MEKHEERLRKGERLCSKKLIDTLFGIGGSHAMTAFPLKAVYRLIDCKSETSAPEETVMESNVQVLVSVPKKHFKRAVKRNRVKRQVREAYRKHKSFGHVSSSLIMFLLSYGVFSHVFYHGC